MKFWSIASKSAKELIRDRRGLIMILIFPLFFMLVFGFAFGGMGQNNEPHDLAVINYDQGTTLPNNENINLGNDLVKVFKDVKYDNSNVQIFNVNETTEQEANKLLKQRKVDAMVVIPKNFTESILASVNAISQGEAASSTTNLIIRGDTSYIGFGTSQGILAGILEKYQDQLLAQLISRISGSTTPETPDLFNSTVEAIPGTETFTNFDFLAPGMIIFAILLLATSVAAGLTKEVDKGTLTRLKLSKMTSFDYLFGNLLPWSLIAALQVLILLAVAVLIGFHWQGGLPSLLWAVLVGIVAGMASIALGMIIASFARNDRQAANLGTIITVPTSFLVGAFFQLPQVVIANFMGQQFQIYDLLPWTHALNALRTLLTFGGGWQDISYQFAWLVGLTALLFLVGVFIFSRTRLKPER